MRQKRIGYVLFFETEQIEARCYCETLNLCENLFASYLVFWDTGRTFPTMDETIKSSASKYIL